MGLTVLSRFLKYIAIGTQFQDEMGVIPSTDKQRNLARLLMEGLNAMGASDVKMDGHAHVCATMPVIIDDTGIMILGLIAHMDTSPAYSDAGVNPQIVRQYNSDDILTNPDTGLTMYVADFLDLSRYVGQDLITTDGSTLLGAGDKAGVAEIMALVGYLLSHPEIRHGTVKVGSTPDEEVGCGVDLFDVADFGVDMIHTMDSGELSELEYENLSAAFAKVHIHGSSVHPGSSKDKMKSVILMAVEFQSISLVFGSPMRTEGYESSHHLNTIEGTVEYARMDYIICDHGMTKFQERKIFIEQVVDYSNRKYGDSTTELFLKGSCFNMKEKTEPHMYLIDTAKAAMEDMGIEPRICPIRGGTDSARLSYMGLPCPNLCAGGRNFHGKYEFISIQSMERAVEFLLNIARNIGA